MGIASGLLLFAVINANSDFCLTCDSFANMNEVKAKSQACQFGTIETGPNEFRCMFEDEYYKITADNIIPNDAFTLENLQTCTNIEGVIWCSQP